MLDQDTGLGVGLSYTSLRMISECLCEGIAGGLFVEAFKKHMEFVFLACIASSATYHSVITPLCQVCQCCYVLYESIPETDFLVIYMGLYP